MGTINLKGESTMSSKKPLYPVTATALTLLAVAIVLILFRETQLKDIAERVIVLALYGLLIVSYFLRIALVFLGAIAIYQMIRERVNVTLQSNDLQVNSIM